MHLFIRTLLLLLASTSMAAADLVELRSLLEQKQYSAAAVAGERLLQAEPGEPEIMFLTAYAMQMQQQTARATRLYQQLINMHPELPEPRNNLAMILLQQEKYDEAARLLIEALNTHPSYATSYRNLNQIYKGIASEAYRRAVSEPDNGESFASSIQLDAIGQLQPIDSPSQLAALSQSSATADAEPAAVAADDSVAEATATEPPEGSLATTTTEATIEPLAAVNEEQATATPEPLDETAVIVSVEQTGATAETSTIKAPEDEGSEIDRLQQQVLSWAEAWSSKAFERYIDFYDSDYRSRFATRADWVEYRRQRIARPGDISVQISNIKTRSLDQARAVLDFEQRYESSNYRDRVIKRLVMKRIDKQWKITAERVLSVL